MNTTMLASTRAFSPLERQLSSYAELSQGEMAAVRDCTDRPPQIVRAGAQILPQGGACVLASGLVGWSWILSDGRRLIVEIAVPGDLLDRRLIPGAVPVALARCKTWDASAFLQGLRTATPGSPLYRAYQQIEEARRRRLVEHALRLGRLSAYERAASLLLDLFERHQRAGISAGERIPWPLTQEMLADTLGLSIVHMNRTIQAIRRSGLVAVGSGYLHILDSARLAEAACREAGRRPAEARSFAPTG